MQEEAIFIYKIIISNIKHLQKNVCNTCNLFKLRNKDFSKNKFLIIIKNYNSFLLVKTTKILVYLLIFKAYV